MDSKTFDPPKPTPETILTSLDASGAADRTAIVDELGSRSYADLGTRSLRWGSRLTGTGASPGDRICYLIPPGGRHVDVLLGIWRSRALAVPLAMSHPPAEIAHVLEDADPVLLLVDPAAPRGDEVARLARDMGIGVVDVSTPAGSEDGPLPGPPRPADPALMIYTSGTTGRPKGVVTTHGNVTAQIHALVDAWAWSPDDRILHVLPLHHVHGLINVLCCALWSGATCEFGPPSPVEIWERLAGGRITLFMAVPTLYRRLIAAWDAADEDTRSRWSTGASHLRLMVSGSAALPVDTLDRWRDITGHTLLERYGMTEIGMGLSNPLHGERRAGFVGQPLPGVEVRIVDGSGTVLGPGRGGEIEVRGPQVFSTYWRRPEATAAAFRDGWFRTGDEGEMVDGAYRILGRQSVDIIKSGGYKVSALEIEDRYRGHPAVADVAVVGVPDPEWGEAIWAAWVPAGGSRPTTEDFRSWGKDLLAPYKVPREFRVVDELPRNAMGKVQKPELVARFARAEGSGEPDGEAPGG